MTNIKLQKSQFPCLNNPSITEIVKDVSYYRNRIKSNKNWLLDVERKAKEPNISLEEMITLDAKWMVEQDRLSKIKGD